MRVFSGFILFVLFIHSQLLSAQGVKSAQYLGFTPSVTVEPFYNKGELDVNVFPVVYQRTLFKRADLRFTSILNLGIREKGNSISHVGFETALPVFFKLKDEKSIPSRGLFLAPVVSLTRNLPEAHNNIGLWIEPGYHLQVGRSWAFSFGLQVGKTYFSYDSGHYQWTNHLGSKIIFGRWF